MTEESDIQRQERVSEYITPAFADRLYHVLSDNLERFGQDVPTDTLREALDSALAEAETLPVAQFLSPETLRALQELDNIGGARADLQVLSDLAKDVLLDGGLGTVGDVVGLSPTNNTALVLIHANMMSVLEDMQGDPPYVLVAVTYDPTDDLVLPEALPMPED